MEYSDAEDADIQSAWAECKTLATETLRYFRIKHMARQMIDETQGDQSPPDKGNDIKSELERMNGFSVLECRDILQLQHAIDNMEDLSTADFNMMLEEAAPCTVQEYEEALIDANDAYSLLASPTTAPERLRTKSYIEGVQTIITLLERHQRDMCSSRLRRNAQELNERMRSWLAGGAV